MLARKLTTGMEGSQRLSRNARFLMQTIAFEGLIHDTERPFGLTRSGHFEASLWGCPEDFFGANSWENLVRSEGTTRGCFGAETATGCRSVGDLAIGAGGNAHQAKFKEKVSAC